MKPDPAVLLPIAASDGSEGLIVLVAFMFNAILYRCVCFIIVSIITVPQEGGGHRLDSLFDRTGVTEYGESVLLYTCTHNVIMY